MCVCVCVCNDHGSPCGVQEPKEDEEVFTHRSGHSQGPSQVRSEGLHGERGSRDGRWGTLEKMDQINNLWITGVNFLTV